MTPVTLSTLIILLRNSEKQYKLSLMLCVMLYINITAVTYTYFETVKEKAAVTIW